MATEDCKHPQCTCLDYCMAEDPYSDVEKPICSHCGDRCTAVEEKFDYSGTHCTGGRDGTHSTGAYVSDCCGEDCSA